jgi:lysophospholipase L1-like esterase
MIWTGNCGMGVEGPVRAYTGRMRRRRRIGSILLAPLFLSACRVSAPAATPVPTPTTTIDLVALGDSTPAAYGTVRSYAQIYATYMEEDLSVVVRFHQWARNGQRASELLANLQQDQALRDAIGQAEVITIWTGFNDIFPAIGIDPRGGVCGPWADLDLNCASVRVAALKSAIDGIVAELLDLADPGKTLILFADVGNPLASRWQELGLLDELKGPIMEAWIDHVSEACEGTGFRVVHTYQALNGPRGDQVVDPGIMQDDGLHLNSDGHKLLADIHRQLGYGPLSG